VGDHRDLALQDLAREEAALLERVIDLTIERDSYRALLGAALEHLNHTTTSLDRARASVARLHDVLRAARQDRRSE